MCKYVWVQWECEFFDEKNISVLFWGGEWFFQKFYDKLYVDEIVWMYFCDDGEYEMQMKLSVWQVLVICQVDKCLFDFEGVLCCEFDLLLLNG